mgnify:CR=1 FL=1
MHKIVIYDGYTTNTGDLSWEPVSLLGELTVYDRTAPEDIISRGQGADVLITNKTVLSADVLSHLTDCRYIGLMSTGVNVVDLEYCDAHKIAVTNIPGYSTSSVAQTTFAMILELTSRVSLHDRYVKSGYWTNCKDFTFRKSPITELDGKIIGIIGYGNIGKKVAEIACSFNMQVLVFARRNLDFPEGSNIRQADLDTLLSSSDIVTLHIPLCAETNKFINEATISQMKQGSFLINTSRGGLIDEKALAQALKDGHLAGAALDVLSSEPPKPDNPMLSCPNCLITPHIAWSSKEARSRLIDILAANLKSYVDCTDAGLSYNAIQNLVNLKNI